MKSYLLLEFKRGLLSKNFLISILLSLFCFALNWYSWRINLLMHKEGLVLFYIAFMDFLPFMAPIIVTLPFVASFIEDKEKFFLKNVLIRKSRICYFIQKYIVTGLLGGLAIALPLFLLLVLNLVVYPKGSVNFFSVVGPFSTVFKYSQFAYAVILIINSYIFGFIYANIGLTMSFFIKNKVFAIISPFLLYILPGFFFIYLHLDRFEPSVTFDFNANSENTLSIVISEFLFLFITSIIAGYIKFIKIDKDEV